MGRSFPGHLTNSMGAASFNQKEATRMRRLFVLAMCVLCLSLSVQAFGQSSNASLSGTVSDAAKALIPGVNITATNTETGVVSTALTNETGTYNMPSLIPGVYKVTAELPGFQTRTFTDVRLGNAAQVRLNFTLEVASLNTTVEVTASAERLLLESTSSVGAVLPEKTVRDLPSVGVMGSDAVDLVRTLPGISLTDPTVPASSLTNRATNVMVAGVSAANVQVQRDGVDATQGVRWPTGISSATVINPDLVGEVRMILAAVDAEVGRGTSQIQFQTRSGTNQFRGAAVWNLQNSALNPNTWANKRVSGKPLTPPWTNLNEGTVSVGGPIVKNKTFFFALWNGLFPETRTLTNPIVLTPCAERGIFRYYDNWNNGNSLQVAALGSTPTIAVVDALGNPKPPATNPDGTPHNGILRYASVFGPLLNTPKQPDCSDAIVQGAPWDSFRTQVDASGYVTKVLGLMPPVNNYLVGDGLNTAGSQWVQRVRGSANRYALGAANIRQQINVKIDHNFNIKHKLSAVWSFERSHDERVGIWPSYFQGSDFSQPQVLTVNFTSTLSPTLVNEARFGDRRTGTNNRGPFQNLRTGKAALAFFPSVQGIPFLADLGNTPLSNGGFSESVLPISLNAVPQNPTANINESSPVYSYADTMSWTRGTHAFKGGVEARFISSRYAADLDSNNFHSYAMGFGGEAPLTPITGINSTNMPGLAGTATAGNSFAMRGLLSLLSGGLSTVTQLYWLSSAKNLSSFDHWVNAENEQRVRELNQQTFSAFFKDDWKPRRDLTLNLGVRWEYYGVPWVSNGLTAAPVGGGNALFGYSGRSFADWQKPGQRGDFTQLQFIGPDSPNPNLRAYKKDWNNFGPAVGFAWQVPWFGAGQTTVRGGYQISFLRDRGFDQGGGGGLSNSMVNVPGASYQASITGGPGDLEYLDITKISRIVPVPVPVAPMAPIPVTARNTGLTAIDPNTTTPYTQSITLAVTRNVARSLTMDARYIGTMGRKLYSNIELNSPNFLFNGLKEAFDAARSGGESALLDQMFKGINIAGAGFGPVGTVSNGVLQTGAQHLRGAAGSAIRNSLANGDYVTLATTLGTLNYSQTGGINANLPAIPVGVNGAVLRFNGFPENFIFTNPQFSTATLQTNAGNTNYHSLQLQATLRPTVGINLQATYTWSKLLGVNGSNPNNTPLPYTVPWDRKADYTLQYGDRRQDFRTNGTFALPFGPRQLLLSKSTGVFARIVENWQMSWIVDLGTGAPTNIYAQNRLYANGVPDVVGPFPRKGKVQWNAGAVNGNYFGNAYITVKDPQCARIAASLQAFCTLNAVADSTGRVVLQNPQPGTRGTLGQNAIQLPRLFTLDMAMSKAFQIRESKRLRFRIDALNVLNHPYPVFNTPGFTGPGSDPTLNINTGTLRFGDITTKTGTRQFLAQLRFEF
ncbi:MAG: hypothetical protein DMG14_15775 [Acidobacteria bacterium]|nr:MAG: hypothetical protein DMG14_15775 [Acidobacteriota bacterium]